MTTNTTLPTLLIGPRRNALLAGHDNELDVLVPAAPGAGDRSLRLDDGPAA
jgi:hypothetical protein